MKWNNVDKSVLDKHNYTKYTPRYSENAIFKKRSHVKNTNELSTTWDFVMNATSTRANLPRQPNMLFHEKKGRGQSPLAWNFISSYKLTYVASHLSNHNMQILLLLAVDLYIISICHNMHKNMKSYAKRSQSWNAQTVYLRQDVLGISQTFLKDQRRPVRRGASNRRFGRTWKGQVNMPEK